MLKSNQTITPAKHHTPLFFFPSPSTRAPNHAPPNRIYGTPLHEALLARVIRAVERGGGMCGKGRRRVCWTNGSKTTFLIARRLIIIIIKQQKIKGGRNLRSQRTPEPRPQNAGDRGCARAHAQNVDTRPDWDWEGACVSCSKSLALARNGGGSFSFPLRFFLPSWLATLFVPRLDWGAEGLLVWPGVLGFGKRQC